MRRSREVRLAILPAIAAITLSACDEQYRVCVDQNNVIVDDGRCTAVVSAAADAGVDRGAPAAYRWYFTARSFSPGQTVTGGSYTPVAGETYASSTRGGGFGATGEGFGAAGGGGVGE